MDNVFGKGVKLVTIFGYEIRVDLSWLILAALITFTLARGFFPNYYTGFSTLTYWLMGIGGAIGLFVSIVLHELSHSLVARNYGIPMKGITLFIFGGVAEMHDQPKTPKSEILMAVAGPIVSVVLGGIFFSIHLLFDFPSEPLHGVLVYLALINVLLAAFNMLPAFPLDGGRILRGALWSWKADLKWATRISSRIGSGFGIALIVLGALDFLMGNFLGGIWLVLIGLFLRGISQNSYKQLLMRQALKGEEVRRFMKDRPVTVPPSATLQELVDDYFLKYHHKFYPVTEDSRLKGCVSMEQVKETPRDQWTERKVEELAVECDDDNSIEADTDASKALNRMSKSKKSRLIVTERGKLAGVLSLKDLLTYLSMKTELEDVPKTR